VINTLLQMLDQYTVLDCV